MHISRYEIFVRVAEIGNITKASRDLGYTQSAVSHALSSLERELGVTLFIRNNHRLYLTPQGSRLLPLARDILNAHSRFLQTVHMLNGQISGDVRVATFSSVAAHWMPHIIKACRQEYPNLQIKIMDGSYQDVEQWLMEGRADCGFIVNSTRKDLYLLPLYRDHLYVILPENHPLCSYETVPIAELKNYHFIVPSEGLNHEVGAILKQAEIDIASHTYLASDHTAIIMVRNGLGISILPELLLINYDRAGFEIRKLDVSSDRTICAATAKMTYTPPAVAAFIRVVQGWLSSIETARRLF